MNWGAEDRRLEDHMLKTHYIHKQDSRIMNKAYLDLSFKSLVMIMSYFPWYILLFLLFIKNALAGDSFKNIVPVYLTKRFLMWNLCCPKLFKVICLFACLYDISFHAIGLWV